MRKEFAGYDLLCQSDLNQTVTLEITEKSTILYWVKSMGFVALFSIMCVVPLMQAVVPVASSWDSIVLLITLFVLQVVLQSQLADSILKDAERYWVPDFKKNTEFMFDKNSSLHNMQQKLLIKNGDILNSDKFA